MLCKGKTQFIFIAAAVFIILYTFIAAIRLKQEVHFIPLWTTDVNLPEKDSADNNTDEVIEKIEEKDFSGKEPFLFVLKNNTSGILNNMHNTVRGRFGFFSEDGTILRTEIFKDRISASASAWVRYAGKAETSNIYSPEGKLLFTVNRAGYTHIEEDRIYLFEPGGSTVCKYGNGKEPIWRFSHTAAITAFNSSASGTIIGYSDGKLVCIDHSGNTVFSFYPGGSNFQIITGAAISDDGKTAVCICGLERQRVVLINISGTHYKIIHHEYLQKDSHKRSFAEFDKKGRFAVFESGDGIGIIDCIKLKIFFINEYGKIIGIGSHPEKDFLTILFQEENICTLAAIRPPDYVIGKTKFNAKSAFLIQDKDRIYLGADTKITAFEIRGLK